MPLTTRYGFAEAPTSAIVGDGSLAWTTSTGALAAAGTTLTVAASAAFPAALEFDIVIGVRDPATGVWATAEVRHVTVVSGTTWTVSAGSIDHVSGSDIAHVLTATALKHNPGALTDAGDLPYLLSTGRMGRLAAPADGAYAVTWASGVPSWTTVGSGLSFADLATPPGGTALGSSAAPFATLTVGPAGHVQIGTPSVVGGTGLYTVSIGPAAWTRFGVDATWPLIVSNLDDDAGKTDLGIAAYVNTTTKYGFAEIDFGLVNSSYIVEGGGLGKWVFLNGVEGWMANDGTITNASWYVYDALASRNVMTLTPTAATFADTVTATDFLLSGGGTLATQTYVNAQGFVTASSATAFTNKTGAISQWTNDASFTTLAAVAGVGYVPGTRTVNGHALSANVTVTASDLSLGSVENAAASGLYVPLTRTVNGHALSANVSVTASDLSLGSVENTALSTWAGTTTVTTLGTIATGVWSGTAIVDGKIAAALTGKTYNGLTLTSTTGTFTLAAAKVFTVSNTLTLAGTDATTMTFPATSATLARTDAANTFTGHQTLEGVTSTGATGTGKFVFDGTPTLVTPVLGAATATSLNGNTFTTGTYTLTGAAGKTLTFNQSITLTGTDAQTYTFPTTSATLARTDAANTFTGVQTMTAPAITGPVTLTDVAGSSALTLTGATQTTSFPLITATQTWNAGAVTFTALKLNVTSTASAAASMFLDFQLAGVSQFSIDKNGNVSALNGVASVGGTLNGFVTTGTKLRQGTGANFQVDATSGLVIANGLALGFNASNATTAPDAFMVRAGAAAIQYGADVNGAAASQILQACNGITGTDKTGGNFTFASGKGTGAGAVSSLIFQTPTLLVSGSTAQSLTTRLTISVNGIAQTAGYHEMVEMTAPAAGAADSVRIYAVDNGSGKTQLMALFSSGAAQQLAIQP